MNGDPFDKIVNLFCESLAGPPYFCDDLLFVYVKRFDISYVVDSPYYFRVIILKIMLIFDRKLTQNHFFPPSDSNGRPFYSELLCSVRLH